MNSKYKIWVTKDNEIPMLTFVKKHNCPGFIYPNMRNGTLFHVNMDHDLVVIMKLAIPCRVVYDSEA